MCDRIRYILLYILLSKPKGPGAIVDVLDNQIMDAQITKINDLLTYIVHYCRKQI